MGRPIPPFNKAFAQFVAIAEELFDEMDDDVEPGGEGADPKAAADAVEASIKLRKARSELRDAKQTRELKEEYAKKIYWLVAYWAIGIFVLVLCVGIGPLPFSLPNWILAAALTTSIANMAGLLFVIVKHLFPNAPK